MTPLATRVAVRLLGGGLQAGLLDGGVRVILLVAGDVGNLDLLGRRALRDDVDHRRAHARPSHPPPEPARRCCPSATESEYWSTCMRRELGCGDRLRRLVGTELRDVGNRDLAERERDGEVHRLALANSLVRLRDLREDLPRRQPGGVDLAGRAELVARVLQDADGLVGPHPHDVGDLGAAAGQQGCDADRSSAERPDCGQDGRCAWEAPLEGYCVESPQFGVCRRG